jgi:hypothetical protein
MEAFVGTSQGVLPYAGATPDVGGCTGTALALLQQGYERANSAHVEELFTSSELPLVVVGASFTGEVRCHSVGARDADAPAMPRPVGLSLDNMFYRAVGGALANAAECATPSLVWRLPTADHGECVIVTCRGELGGEAIVVLLIGQRKRRATNAPSPSRWDGSMGGGALSSCAHHPAAGAEQVVTMGTCVVPLEIAAEDHVVCDFGERGGRAC